MVFQIKKNCSNPRKDALILEPSLSLTYPKLSLSDRTEEELFQIFFSFQRLSNVAFSFSFIQRFFRFRLSYRLDSKFFQVLFFTFFQNILNTIIIFNQLNRVNGLIINLFPSTFNLIFTQQFFSRCLIFG